MFVLVCGFADREYLRQVIAVALAVAPMATKKAFADRHEARHWNAQRQLSQAVADAVLQTFTVERKPLPPPGPGVPSRPPEG
jgi:hypothetical protein